jgi:Fe2+ transport system protein B
MTFIPVIVLFLSFRISIKSTSLGWLPLLWIMQHARPVPKKREGLKLISREPWTIIILVYSIFVIVGFGSKILLIIGTWKFAHSLMGSVGQVLNRLVAPFDLPLWQVAATLNAMLAWAFFLRAKRHILAYGSAAGWSETWIQREYIAFQATRTTLSLYTIVCTLYIIVSTA